jgi:hypothetical protein
MYDVEAPQEALDQLPQQVFASSEWTNADKN